MMLALLAFRDESVFPSLNPLNAELMLEIIISRLDFHVEQERSNLRMKLRMKLW